MRFRDQSPLPFANISKNCRQESVNQCNLNNACDASKLSSKLQVDDAALVELARGGRPGPECQSRDHVALTII